MGSPCKPHRQPLHSHCDLTVRSRRSHGVVGDLTALLRWPYGEAERRATAFVLSMHKVRAVAQRSMRSNGVQWRCHDVAAAMLAFPRRAGRRSGFFRTPWERRPGVTATLKTHTPDKTMKHTSTCLNFNTSVFVPSRQASERWGVKFVH